MIRTRNDLIEWLVENAPYPRIKRALLRGGTNENLGGFRAPHWCGWIVRVWAKSHVDFWNVRVMPYGASVRAVYLTDVLEGEEPWEYWDGDESENPLYQGDNSEKYKENRDAARLQRPDNAEQDT